MTLATSDTGDTEKELSGKARPTEYFIAQPLAALLVTQDHRIFKLWSLLITNPYIKVTENITLKEIFE